MAWRVFAVVTVAVFVGSGALAGDAKKDLEMLQGTWQAEKFSSGGMDMPAEILKEVKIVIKGDEIKDDKGDNSKPGAKFKLDPTKKPKEIDFTPVDATKGKKGVGIYDIQGDTLKISMAETVRPKDFDAPKGQDGVLMVFKRVKK